MYAVGSRVQLGAVRILAAWIDEIPTITGRVVLAELLAAVPQEHENHQTFAEQGVRSRDELVRVRQARGSARAVGDRIADDVGQIDARGVHALLFQHDVQPRVVRALRQPEAARPSARAQPVRLDAGAHLQPHAGVRGQQRQHGVRRGRGPARKRRQRAEQVATQPLEALQRALVLLAAALDRLRDRAVAGRARRAGVEAVRRTAHVAQEGPVALTERGRDELVAQHGRQRERDRRAGLEHVEDRQVRRRHRLEEPLLAEGPGPEPLHVRHVGVEDEGELARS